MQHNTLKEYIAPELTQIILPSMTVTGLSNLNDPRDTRNTDDEWIKYEDTDEEL